MTRRDALTRRRSRTLALGQSRHLGKPDASQALGFGSSPDATASAPPPVLQRRRSILWR